MPAAGGDGGLPALGTQGGGAPAAELDWPAAKARINDLRSEVAALLDQIDPDTVKEWHSKRDALNAELANQGIPLAERDAVIAEKIGSRPDTEQITSHAEALAREAGQLIDSEIERRVGPPPPQPEPEDLAATQEALDAAAAIQSKAMEAYEEAVESDASEETLAELKAHWAETGIAVRAASDARWNLTHTDPDRTWRTAQADAAKDVLSEVRAMGGNHSFHPKSQKPAVKAVEDALACFPTDWVDRSNASGDSFFLRHTKGRAHYEHATNKKFSTVSKLPPMGYSVTAAPNEDFDAYVAQVSAPGATVRAFGTSGKMRDAKVLEVVSANPATRKVELRVDGGRGKSSVSYETVSVLTTDKSVDTTIHELAHRMEFTNPRIVQLERAFYRRRTRLYDGSVEDPVPYNGDVKEKVRPDGFVDEYVGKDYGPAASAFEVMSIGMEGVFAGDYGALRGVDTRRGDEDHRAFVLGVLATV